MKVHVLLYTLFADDSWLFLNYLSKVKRSEGGGHVFFLFFYEVVDDWKERTLTSQLSAEVLCKEMLNK